MLLKELSGKYLWSLSTAGLICYCHLLSSLGIVLSGRGLWDARISRSMDWATCSYSMVHSLHLLQS